MEHLHDLGRRQQHDRPTPAGTFGERGQHLHPVARPEALGHVSRAGWTGSSTRSASRLEASTSSAGTSSSRRTGAMSTRPGTARSGLGRR